MIDPVVLDLPNAVDEKPGCAPLLLRFGPYLDLSVGPFGRDRSWSSRFGAKAST
jgi:hypothetical protein